jgi:hypothetical protein
MGCSSGKTSPSQFYQWVLRLCTHLNVYGMARHEGKRLWHEVMVCDDQINHIQVTAVDTVRGQLFFVRGSIRHRCDARVQAEGGHFELLLLLGTVHSVR